MLQLKENASLAPFPAGRVIKAADYAATLEAQDILAAARAEAGRIVADAKATYESEKIRGREDGLAEGKEWAAEQMLETAARGADYLASLEERVVDVVVRSLRRIVGEMDDRERIVRVVRHALEVVRNQRQVILRVSPAEIDAVRARLHEILAGFPGVTNLEVTAAGGCILETEIGVVDASVDVQLEAIVKALTKRMKGES